MANCKVKAYDLGVHRVSLGLVQAARGFSFDQYQATEPFNKFVSFTSLLYHPDVRLVYCGLTSWKNDLLYAFDPKSKCFESMNLALIHI